MKTEEIEKYLIKLITDAVYEAAKETSKMYVKLESKEDEIVDVEQVISGYSVCYMYGKKYFLNDRGEFEQNKAKGILRTGIKRRYNKTKKCFVLEE